MSQSVLAHSQSVTTHSLFIKIGRHCVALERAAIRERTPDQIGMYHDRIRELRIVQDDIRRGGYNGRVADLHRYVEAVYKVDLARYDLKGVHPELPGYDTPWEISSLIR